MHEMLQTRENRIRDLETQVKDLMSTVKDGKDGEPGPMGPPGQPGADGKDGAPGAKGEDGLGYDDLEEEISDDGRLIIRRYKRGALTKEFRHRVPTPIYRGVYKEGEYDRGDQVTWAGSIWTCMAPTNTKPGDGNKSWQLSCKRGRDGKDGEKGEKGDPGDKNDSLADRIR